MYSVPTISFSKLIASYTYFPLHARPPFIGWICMLRLESESSRDEGRERQ